MADTLQCVAGQPSSPSITAIRSAATGPFSTFARDYGWTSQDGPSVAASIRSELRSSSSLQKQREKVLRGTRVITTESATREVSARARAPPRPSQALTPATQRRSPQFGCRSSPRTLSVFHVQYNVPLKNNL